jgi:hypothetical protein
MQLMFASSKLVKPRHPNYPYPYDFKDVVIIFPYAKVMRYQSVSLGKKRSQEPMCPFVLSLLSLFMESTKLFFHRLPN